MVEPPLWPVSWGWFGHLQRSQRKKEKKKNCEGFGPRTTPMAKAYKRKEKRKKKRKKKRGFGLGVAQPHMGYEGGSAIPNGQNPHNFIFFNLI
jgi:hypothetical protein